MSPLFGEPQFALPYCRFPRALGKVFIGGPRPQHRPSVIAKHRLRLDSELANKPTFQTSKNHRDHHRNSLQQCRDANPRCIVLRSQAIEANFSSLCLCPLKGATLFSHNTQEKKDGALREAVGLSTYYDFCTVL